MEDKKETEELRGFYKGYELRWLEKQTDHPDYYLVAEAKALEEDK